MSQERIWKILLIPVFLRTVWHNSWVWWSFVIAPKIQQGICPFFPWRKAVSTFRVIKRDSLPTSNRIRLLSVSTFIYWLISYNPLPSVCICQCLIGKRHDIFHSQARGLNWQFLEKPFIFRYTHIMQTKYLYDIPQFKSNILAYMVQDETTKWGTPKSLEI